MRKLGILIATLAVTALTVVGFAASPAQAQSSDDFKEGVCEGVIQDRLAEGARENDGEPLTSTFDGAAESCRQSADEMKLKPSPLLCGIAKGLDARPGGELGSTAVVPVNDGIAGSPIGDTPVATFEACPTEPQADPGPTKENPPAGNGGGGAEVAPQVLANNAAGDGGMPRTGGELFAGAGFALASVGALIRRFVG